MDSIKLIIYGFMAIIVGLALIIPVADQVELVKVASRTITNESVTLTSNAGNLYAYTTRTYSATACRNQTVTIPIGTYCNISTKGAVKTYSGNFSTVAYVDYTYEPNDYVDGATSRALVTLTVMFFALGIMAVGVGLCYKGFKDSGIF